MVFQGYWGKKSLFPLCAPTCCASLALATLDIKLGWSVFLKSGCLGPEEP